jgi:hypothetical protein
MISRNKRCVIIFSATALIALTLLIVIIIFDLLKLSATPINDDVYTLIQVITGALGILFSVIEVGFYLRDRHESRKGEQAKHAKQVEDDENVELQKLPVVKQIEHKVGLCQYKYLDKFIVKVVEEARKHINNLCDQLHKARKDVFSSVAGDNFETSNYFLPDLVELNYDDDYGLLEDGAHFGKKEFIDKVTGVHHSPTNFLLEVHILHSKGI